MLGIGFPFQYLKETRAKNNTLFRFRRSTWTRRLENRKRLPAEKENGDGSSLIYQISLLLPWGPRIPKIPPSSPQDGADLWEQSLYVLYLFCGVVSIRSWGEQNNCRQPSVWCSKLLGGIPWYCLALGQGRRMIEALIRPRVQHTRLSGQASPLAVCIAICRCLPRGRQQARQVANLPHQPKCLP